MGQKVNPIGLRVGIIRDWEGRWFAEKDYATLLHEDLKIRRFIKEKIVWRRSPRPKLNGLQTG